MAGSHTGGGAGNDYARESRSLAPDGNWTSQSGRTILLGNGTEANRTAPYRRNRRKRLCDAARGWYNEHQPRSDRWSAAPDQRILAAITRLDFPAGSAACVG